VWPAFSLGSSNTFGVAANRDEHGGEFVERRAEGITSGQLEARGAGVTAPYC
jgi:hypothetical protein